MLLNKNQQIQLSDFGLAVIAQNIDVTPRSSAGTTAYMAPEQLQGQPCRASDQYALAIVVYEWLCGSGPFSGSEREVTIQQLYSPPPPLSSRIPDISPAIEQVIMKALMKDPQARFASVQEFALALERAAPSATLPDTGKERTPGPSAYEQAAPFPSQEQTHDLPAQQKTISVPSTFSPQLPLMVYESTLTNNRRILQPSMESLTYSLEGPSLAITSSSEEETSHTALASAYSNNTTVSGSCYTCLPPCNNRTEGKTAPSLPPVQPSTPKKRYVGRNTPLTTLIGIAIIGLILLASLSLWTQFLPNKSKASLTNLPSTGHTSTAGNTTTPRQSGSPTTNPSNGNIPTKASQSGTLPGLTPIPGTHPTPISTIGAQPTSIPTSVIVPTAPATTTITLTVGFVDPPSKAVVGSIITIVTRASEGGVTIALNGKVRSFGELTANSQGIASFQIKVPSGTRMILTATATDATGNMAQSSAKTIVIKKKGD